MNDFGGLGDQLVETYRGFLVSIIQAIPGVVTGIALILFSWLTAKIIERLVRLVLTRIGLDAAITRFNMEPVLKRLGITKPLSRLIPRVVYFLLLFLFAQTAAEALGLDAITDAIAGFLGYVPNLVAAVLLLIGGSLAGQFLEGAITRSAKEAGIDYAGTLGSLASVLVLFVAGIMALAQLKLHPQIITIITACALGGLAIAFGISFGLGTREITRSIVAGFYARKIFQVGRPLEVRGERGVLKAITPTQTILEREEGTAAIANTALMDEVVRQEA